MSFQSSPRPIPSSHRFSHSHSTSSTSASSSTSPRHSLQFNTASTSTGTSLGVNAGTSSSPARASTLTPTPQASQGNRRTITTGRNTNSAHLRSSIFDTHHIHTPSNFHSSSSAVGGVPLMRNMSSNIGIGIGLNREESTHHRDHSTVNFEWTIHGLEYLKRSLEDNSNNGGWGNDILLESGGNGEVAPELLRRGLIIGEGWYKVDMSRTNPPTPVFEDEPPSSSSIKPEETEMSSAEPPISLAIYITALSFESTLLDYSHSASIFVGIKSISPSSSIGRKYAETQYSWHYSTDHVFSRDTDYLEVSLPNWEELVNKPEIQGGDGFTLCIQVSSPVGFSPGFRLPGEVVVPPNLVDGLRGLLDSRTGDVKFVCLEHKHTSISGSEEEDNLGPKGNKVKEKEGEGETTLTLSRKRILYAHSDILKSRSEYFKALLSGGFSEVETAKVDGRETTLIVDDAAFDTVYWMLRFVYCNELDFSPQDNVRKVMELQQLHKPSITRLLTTPQIQNQPSHLGEWEYRHIPSEMEIGDDEFSELELDIRDFDNRTVHSVSSAGTSVSRRVSAISPPPSNTSSRVVSTGRNTSPTGASTISKASSGISVTSRSSSRISPTSNTISSSSTPRARGPSTATPTPGRAPPTPTTQPQSSHQRRQASQSLPRTNPNPPPSSSTKISPTKPNPLTSPQSLTPRHYPSTHRHHPEPIIPDPDPHPHPTQTPPPASALSIYILSHRYRLEQLQNLAKEHILQTLDHDNCMPMLLATYHFGELHNDILEYVVYNFQSVQIGEEFKRSVKEVSQGVWGDTGGLVILGLFSKL